MVSIFYTAESEIMPRNTYTVPGSYPSDGESPNHSGHSRLRRNRVDPRRERVDTPIASSNETDSEDFEASRGRYAEGGARASNSLGYPHFIPDDVPRRRDMPDLDRGHSGRSRDFPESDCSLIFQTSQLTRHKGVRNSILLRSKPKFRETII